MGINVSRSNKLGKEIVNQSDKNPNLIRAKRNSLMPFDFSVSKMNTIIIHNIVSLRNGSSVDPNIPTSSSSKSLNSIKSGLRTKFPLELSMRHQELISKCWELHISTVRKDIFHKTMLFSIEASPKLNEVIACGKYCFRDLTKWPKLNRICQAQFIFFHKLIFDLNLNEEKLFNECIRLGEMHAQYAQFGLKPHFLDIFQQNFIANLQRIQIDDNDKMETIMAFTILTSFIVDVMNYAYARKLAEYR